MGQSGVLVKSKFTIVNLESTSKKKALGGPAWAWRGRGRANTTQQR